MAPKKAAGAKSRSVSPKAKAEPKAKADPKAKAAPKAAAPSEVEQAENLLRECIAPDDISGVDGRVLDIAVLQGRQLVEKGLDSNLLDKAEARLAEYREFEVEIKKRADELNSMKAEVIAQQDEENVLFTDGCEARQSLKSRVEELFDAVGDSEIDKVKSWIKDCCAGGGTDAFARPPLPLDLEDHQQNTPLSEAACFGETDIVELLLASGAHPNSQNCQGRTPIWRATYNGHEDLVQLLLEKGADPKIETVEGVPAGREGTAQTKALLEGWDYSQTAQRQEALTELQRLPKPWPHLLLDAVKAGDAGTALQVINAIKENSAASGVAPEALLRVVLDFDSMTDALWLSCTLGHLELCRALLDAKADVDSSSDTGLTCLMIACRKNNKDIVRELLGRGAKTHLRSQQQRLATDYAREPEDDYIHEMIVSHCQKTKDWTTLEEEARQSGGNKACSAEILEKLQDDRRNAGASNHATAALKSMSAEELREGGDSYKQLLEERALADVLGIG